VNLAALGRVRSEGNDAVWNWKFRVLNAEILLWEYRFDEAASLVNPSLPGMPNSSELAFGRELVLAKALYGGGKLDEAAVHIGQAQKIAETSGPQWLGDVALARGILLLQRRDYLSAEREFLTALQAARTAGNKMLEAKALGMLGHIYTAQGRYDKSLDQDLASLNVSQSLAAHHVEAVTRLNIGWSYMELGDFDQAIPFFKESQALAATAGMPKTKEEALNDLGKIYFNQGKNEAADEYYRQALAVARSLQDRSSIALYLDNLALVTLALGHLDEADTYNREALIIQREVRDRREELRSLTTTAKIADARKQFTSSKSILDSVLADVDTPTSVRWEAEHELASLYVQTGRKVQAEIEFKKGLGILDRSWTSIRQEEHKLAFSLWAADFYTDYIRFLVDQKDLVKALQVSELMRARTREEALGKTDAGRMGPSAIQAFLRTQGKVVLTYWLGQDQSYLWVITPIQFKLLTLPSKQEIEAKVNHYQQRVSSLEKIEPADVEGQELYQILVEPARKLIPRKAQVVIIPDGSLGKLNFETLIVPGSQPHFWIDDAQIEDASSIALLVKSRPSRPGPHKLLAIGDPLEVTPDYPQLKYARQEIKAAAEHFGAHDRKVVSGPEAVPSAYAASHPGRFDVIHFATHGFASEMQPLDSAIILSSQDDHNFKLYARDIVKTRLNAEIVTISACYGAGKRTYSGEGLVGLAWSFLRAGAHQVIAGLWNVEDQPTPDLMRNFYTELTNGKSPAAALRDAKLKMLHSNSIYRVPYYWGSLQLYTGS
jgi:CHAT domain-containing protein